MFRVYMIHGVGGVALQPRGVADTRSVRPEDPGCSAGFLISHQLLWRERERETEMREGGRGIPKTYTVAPGEVTVPERPKLFIVFCLQVCVCVSILAV